MCKCVWVITLFVTEAYNDVSLHDVAEPPCCSVLFESEAGSPLKVLSVNNPYFASVL